MKRALRYIKNIKYTVLYICVYVYYVYVKYLSKLIKLNCGYLWVLQQESIKNFTHVSFTYLKFFTRMAFSRGGN